MITIIIKTAENGWTIRRVKTSTAREEVYIAHDQSELLAVVKRITG